MAQIEFPRLEGLAVQSDVTFDVLIGIEPAYPVEDPKQCGLAAAGRAYDRRDCVVVDLQRDVDQRGLIAVAEGQVRRTELDAGMALVPAAGRKGEDLGGLGQTGLGAVGRRLDDAHHQLRSLRSCGVFLCWFAPIRRSRG